MRAPDATMGVADVAAAFGMGSYAPEPLRLDGRRTGLLVVDEVVGFCVPGAGPLAPASPSPAIERMIAETDRLARGVGTVLAFRDSHAPGQVEVHYPPHRVVGSGHDELVPRLRWLERSPTATVLAKSCVDAYVGAADPDGNRLARWILEADLERLVVAGICTDICVLSAVTSILSARTLGALGRLDEVAVHADACATYDLPLAAARAAGLPDSAAHPAGPFAGFALLAMRNQGATITSGTG